MAGLHRTGRGVLDPWRRSTCHILHGNAITSLSIIGEPIISATSREFVARQIKNANAPDERKIGGVVVPCTG